MSTLVSLFKSLTAARENRLNCLHFIESHPELKNEFFELAHDSKANRENIYAAWVWEFYILKDVTRYIHFLDASLRRLIKIENSSMRRPHSKTLWHVLKNKTYFDALSNNQKECVIAMCLDWIITEDKTAPLNFCIRILILFRKEFPETQTHLEDLILHSNRTFPKGIYTLIRSVFKN